MNSQNYKGGDTPWSPCRYRLYGLFLEFLTFVLHVLFSIANSSFKNKNWYNKVTSYPMDLTWKIFFCPKKSKISTFHFLNLSPALPNFGASYLQTDWYRQATVFTKWFFLTLVLIWSWSHIHEKPWDVQYFDRQQSFTRVSQWKHF